MKTRPFSLRNDELLFIHLPFIFYICTIRDSPYPKLDKTIQKVYKEKKTHPYRDLVSCRRLDEGHQAGEGDPGRQDEQDLSPAPDGAHPGGGEDPQEGRQ